MMTVHNDGSPIPAAALSTIFDPLRRIASGDLPRRNRPVGIGLGLYITHQVVTSHGGSIGVTSSADTGTTFTVRLPRQPIINRIASQAPKGDVAAVACQGN